MMPPSNLLSIPNGGLAVIAEYNEQLLVEYKGNPLIEALPLILSKDQFVEAAQEYPAFDESERNLDSWVRLHCVERLSRFFQPLERHIDLEQKISRVLRQGYLARNPFTPVYATRLSSNQQINQIGARGQNRIIRQVREHAVFGIRFHGDWRVGCRQVNSGQSHSRFVSADYPALRVSRHTT
jgi:hypothetical protein